MNKNNVINMKNNKGKEMDTEMFNKMMKTVEEFTVEYIDEIREECGYTFADIMNNTGGARVGLSEGVALILTMIYGEEAFYAFMEHVGKNIVPACGW